MRCFDRTRLSALVRGSLSDRDFANAMAHARNCSSCRAALRELGSDPDLAALSYVPANHLIVASVGGGERPSPHRSPPLWDESDTFDEADAFADAGDVESYMPSEALVERVLAASSGNRRRFRFLGCESSVIPIAQGRARRVAATVFATLGLSPGVLAAATLGHVAAFGVLGWWIIVAVLGSPVSEKSAVNVNAEHVAFISFDPRNATSSVEVTRPSRQSTARANADLRLRRETVRAVNQTAVFVGRGNELDSASSVGLTRVATVLRLLPGVRIALDVAKADDPAAPSMARAEVLKRLLVVRRIDAKRIDIVQVPRSNAACDVNDPRCAPAPGTVRIRVTTIDGKSPY